MLFDGKREIEPRIRISIDFYTIKGARIPTGKISYRLWLTRLRHAASKRALPNCHLVSSPTTKHTMPFSGAVQSRVQTQKI